MRVRQIALALVLGIAMAAGSHAAETLSNQDILKMSQAGLGTPVIVAKIEASATAFDTGVDTLVALAEKGVDSDVLKAMVDTGGRATGAPEVAVGTDSPRPNEAPADVAGAEPPTSPGSTFRERLRSGGEGPFMVVIPAGRFRMGCLVDGVVVIFLEEPLHYCSDWEKPAQAVTIEQPFAVSVYEVTFEDYDRFTYPNEVDDQGWGRGRRPVVAVSWHDAKEYAEWLSSETEAEYRLLTEAEWEYAARAGSTTRYSWGNELGVSRANCAGCGSRWDDQMTAPVGSFRPNAFGLHDMHGNVWEWVEDCWRNSYAEAPNCAWRAGRGGSWYSAGKRSVRSAHRYWHPPGDRYLDGGFRVARTLSR